MCHADCSLSCFSLSRLCFHVCPTGHPSSSSSSSSKTHKTDVRPLSLPQWLPVSLTTSLSCALVCNFCFRRAHKHHIVSVCRSSAKDPLTRATHQTLVETHTNVCVYVCGSPARVVAYECIHEVQARLSSCCMSSSSSSSSQRVSPCEPMRMERV